MLKYFSKRVLSIIPIILGVSIIVFIAIQLAPGDAAEIMLGSYATTEDVAAVRSQLGLDQPVVVQYFKWLGRALTGDFGTSITYRQPVLDLILGKVVNTLTLGLAALVIAVPVGIGTGIVCAVRKDRWIDRMLMGGTFVGISIPVFWLGMILIIVFSQLLGWFPSSGMHSAGQTGFLDMLRHIVLPAVTLSLIPTSVIARITKSSMLEVMGQDYIRTAQAKGCTPRRKIAVHAIKNALVPILSILGIEVGYVIGGALVVENVFAWPGLGSTLLTAVLTRDFSVVVCGTCIICIVYALINLVNDLLYGVVDPRIQYE